MLLKCCTQYASKFGKLSSGHRTGKGVFILIPKKGNAKECSNYHTFALISHTSKVMLKILQARLKQYLLTSVGSSQKQESSRKTSIFALLTTPKPLTVGITTNWSILQEMEIPDHLICFLRNLYAGREATVRTGHGTAD